MAPGVNPGMMTVISRLTERRSRVEARGWKSGETLSPSVHRTPDVPADDAVAALASAPATPSEEDEQLARAWARAGELAVALRETTEELAVARRRNRSLEAELERMRAKSGAGAGRHRESALHPDLRRPARGRAPARRRARRPRPRRPGRRRAAPRRRARRPRGCEGDRRARSTSPSCARSAPRSTPSSRSGAIADDGQLILDGAAIADLGISRAELAETIDAERAELERRREINTGANPSRSTSPAVRSCSSTTASPPAAPRSPLPARCGAAARAGVILAVPVGPQGVDSALAGEFDEVICPLQPRHFGGVGRWYDDFSPTTATPR